MTAKILDMGRRACRWCQHPTGSLSLTCKRLDCQLKTSQWRVVCTRPLSIQGSYEIDELKRTQDE